jgi:CO/xanthine dehydrogenase Mo-binding subunit
MTSVLVENRDGPGPGGAKGSGEGGLLATSSAIASALTEAADVVIRDLPLTPERIWLALRERDQANTTESNGGYEK